MDYKQLKTDFDRDGFVVIRGFLPDDELAALKDQVDRYIRDVVPGLPESEAFYQNRTRPETLKQLHHMARDPFFADYRHNPRWTKTAEMLVGEPVECLEPEWFNKPPGAQHPTPPHQDNFYFCLEPPHVVSLWLALDAVDEENGCLRYVRGSHREGIRPHRPTSVLGFSQGISDYGPEDQQREQTVLLSPGDLLAHHGVMIHRADPNRTTDRHRRAFAMVYRGVSCRRDPAAYERYERAMQEQHRQMGLLNLGE